MKSILSRGAFLAVAILCLVLTADSFPASGAAGRVEETSGSVWVERGGGRRAIGRSAAIHYGDTLITGKDGRIRFTLTDAGSFTLESDTSVSIDELFEEAEDEPMVLRMAAGYLWARVSRLSSSPRRLEIHTPTVIAGVRGTEFELAAAADGSAAMAVDEGSVEMAVDGETLLVDKGSMAEVDADTGKGSLAPAPERRRRDWMAWRAERAVRLPDRLPMVIERAAAKVSRMERELSVLGGSVFGKADDLAGALEDTRAALGKKGSKAALRQARLAAGKAGLALRREVRAYRRALNRLRVDVNFARTLEHSLETAGDRVPPETAALLRGRLAETLQTGDRLILEARQLRERVIGLFRSLYRTTGGQATDKRPAGKKAGAAPR